MKNCVRLSLTGVNISRLYKILKKNDIEMLDINRLNHKTIVFSVPFSKHKKLFNLLKNSNYNISIINYFGLCKILHFFKKRYGYLIGLFLGAFIIFFSNFFVSDIKIYGNQKIEQNQIVTILKNNGIRVGATFNFDVQNIEKLLENNFNDISLVSVIKKGTTIIINIKEKQSLDKIDNIS